MQLPVQRLEPAILVMVVQLMAWDFYYCLEWHFKERLTCHS